MSSLVNRINSTDSAIIETKHVNDVFGLENDVAEIHIYDLNGNILTSDYNYTSYQNSTNYGMIGTSLQSIQVNPELDCSSRGYSNGSFVLHYNFLRNLSNESFFIKQISSDRKEIAISSNILSNIEIESLFNVLSDNLGNYTYVKTYLLNFSNDKFSFIVNVALNTNEEIYEIFVKLYEPLDSSIQLKSLCKVQQEVIPTNVIEFEFIPLVESTQTVKTLTPNFDLELDYQKAISTDYLNIETISSNIEIKNPLRSLINNKSVQINIDFEDFSDFVHLSSAVSRVKNFVLKVKQLELLQENLDNNVGNQVNIENRIKDILSNLDIYEYFLYTSPSTKAYPKVSGSLAPSDSILVTTWLGNSNYGSGIIGQATEYDDFNESSLKNNLPEYIVVDSKNEPLVQFVNMMGHHFDNIWVYINKMTDVNLANNNLGKGISPDLVETILRSFGMKLYNSLSDVDVTDENKILYSKEIYKRLYHNLPQLFKSKGSINGLRQLINVFGVPDTVLRISEYGSLDTSINNYLSQEHVFNYSLATQRSEYVQLPFKKSGSQEILPSSFSFRTRLNTEGDINYITIGDFDPRDFDSRDFYFVTYSGSYSLGDFDERDFNDNDFQTNITIQSRSETLFHIFEAGNPYLSVEIENINDNIPELYIKYGNLSSTKIPLEIYGDWFYCYLERTNNSVSNRATYTLKIVKEDDTKTPTIYSTSLSIFDEQSNILGKNLYVELAKDLDCNIQSVELRSDILSNDYLITRFNNPKSVENTSKSSFIDNLLFYLPLGTDLITYNHSTVTQLYSRTINGYFSSTPAFFINFPNQNNYQTNYDVISYNPFSTPSQNRIGSKISIKSKQYYENVVSNLVSIETTDNDFNDLRMLDVVLSPTFEQDDDIISTLGHIRIDDYIGDPSELQSSRYTSLEQLKKLYIQRLIGQFNVKDYINLIRYIDNSLFKMIYDFTPSSMNTSAGLLIRQSVLHRNKIQSYKINVDNLSTDDIVFDKFDLEFTDQTLNDWVNLNASTTFIPNNKNPYLNKRLKKQDKQDFLRSYWFVDATPPKSNFETFETGVLSSKYTGSKLSSKQYNTYTQGDVSLGKTSCVDRYSDKIALFTDAETDKIFTNKTNFRLKYLVDKDGNLTDLNLSNNNLYDIQNYFPRESNLVVSQFDNKKYSNQKQLDGNKKIFTSGFSYEPCFYYSSKDKYFRFEPIEQEDSTFLRCIEPADRDISSKKFVYDLFAQKDIDTTGGFTVGNESDMRFSSYSINKSNQYQFNLDINLLVKPKLGSFSFKYRLSTYKNYISDDAIIDSVTYTYNPKEIQYDPDGNEISIVPFGKVQRNLELPVAGTETMEAFNRYWSQQTNSVGGRIPYVANRLWKWDGITRTDTDFRTYRIYVSDDTDAYQTGKLYEVKTSLDPNNQTVEKLYDEYWSTEEETVNISIPVYDFVLFGGFFGNMLIGNRGILSRDYTGVKNSNSFSKFDKVYFVLEQIESTDVQTNDIILLKSSSLYTTKDISNLKLSDSEAIITNISPKSISINPKLKSYLNQSIYNSSGSLLYSKYGDTNEIFTIEKSDYIYIKDSKTQSYYYLEVESTTITQTSFILNLLNSAPSYLQKENIQEAVFVKTIKDETSIVVDFKKKEGSVYYGFLLPNNASPNILKNINTITKQLNQKLINEVSISRGT